MAVADGYVLLGCGMVEEAVLVLEPAVNTCREKNFAGQLIPALTILGHAHALAGRPAEGILLIKEAVARHEKVGAFARRAYWLYTLATAYLHAGQLNDAETTAQDALGFAARHGEHWVEGWTKTILAEVASRRSDAQSSMQRFAEAQQIGTELGMRPLVAHCHLSLGKLYRRTGKREQAREHLTIATTMYREMDMRFWLEQVEAEMGGLG
jgi:tetratricopeptide (TPR) repeat protein